MTRKSRPPVHSPAGSFLPAFAPLDEDPAARRMDGWIADEDEHVHLASRLESEGRVVLVLGAPSQASVDLLAAWVPGSCLLMLPPSTSPSERASKSVVHLQAAATPSQIGKAFEEALTIAARWRKGKAKESRRSFLGPGAGDKRRGSVLGFGAFADPSAGSNASGSLSRPVSRLSRPASVASFGSDSQSQQASGPTRQAESFRPIDIVLHFLPSPPPKDPTNLQTLLSSSFLVTTVALPILAGNKRPVSRDASPPPPPSLSPNRPRPSSKLSNSTSSQSIRRPSESSLRQPVNLFTLPVSLSASTPSSPVSKTRALSRPVSVFSNSDLSPPSEAMLVHVLPDDAPPLLPMLLDKFMKPTLAPQQGKVSMIMLPEAILGSGPFVFREDDGSTEREGDETEEEDEPHLGSPSGSANSHASSSHHHRTPSRHRRDLSTSSFIAPPTILSLLLTSSLRPPLVIPRSMMPSPRRGSATSTSSFRSSSLNPTTTPSPSAALPSVPTFIPTSEAVTFIPRVAPHPSSSSSMTSLRASDSLGLTMTPATSCVEASGGGDVTPKLEMSGSVSDSDGGVGTPRASVELKDVRVVVPAECATEEKTKKKSGGGWFSKMFGGGTKKNKTKTSPTT